MPKFNKRRIKERDKQRKLISNRFPSKANLPNRNNHQLFGKIIEVCGIDEYKVLCEDGTIRVGNLKSQDLAKSWIEKGDLIILKKNKEEKDMAQKMEKCTIVWKYLDFEISLLVDSNNIPQELGF